MADGRVTIDFDVNKRNIDGTISDLNNNLSNTDKQGQRASNSIGNIVKALGLVKLASSAIGLLSRSLEGAVSRYDTMNQFPRVMEQMGFGAEESSDAVDKLSDGLKGLPTPLNEAVANAQRIAILTGNLDTATDTTLALNNAFLSSGSSTADASRGLQQYVQMLSRGEVDLMSWRTLQETMGPALNEVAKSFGFAGQSAQTDFYDALKGGEISFNDFNERLIELDGGVNGFADRARTASEGIATSFANMRTAVVRGLEGLIRSIDETLRESGLPSIGEMIEMTGERFEAGLSFMAENLPVVAGFMADMYDEAVRLTPELLGLSAAIATFVIVLNFVSWMESGYLALLYFGDAVVKLGGTLKSIGLVLASTTGIIAILVAAVVGLGVWFVTAYKTNEEFRDSVNAAWASVKAFVIPIIDFIVDKLRDFREWITQNTVENERFRQIMSSAWQGIQSVVSTVWGFLGGVFTAMMDFFQAIGPSVVSGFGVAVSWFGQLAESASVLWDAFMQSSIVQGAISLLGFAFDNVTGQISGFIDAVKAVFTDLDFGPLLEQAALLVPRLIGIFIGGKVGLVLAGANIIRMIADGMGLTVPELIQQVTDVIVNVIEQFAEALPLYIEQGTQILESLIAGFSAAIPGVAESASNVILTLVTAITTALPTIITAGVGILTTLIDGIATTLPIILSVGIQIITTLLGALITALPVLIEAGILLLTTLVDAITVLLPILIEVGIQIITTLLNALITALPLLIEAGILLLTTLVNAIITLLPQIIDAGIQLIMALINGIISILPALIDAGITLILALVNAFIGLLPVLIDAGIQILLALVGGLIQVLPALIDAGIQILLALVDAFITLLPVLINAGVRILTALIKGLWDVLPQLLSAGWELIKALIGAILEMLPEILSAGVQLIESLIGGLWDMAGSLWDAAIELGSGIIDEFKGIDLVQVGKDIISGLISGIGSMVGSAVKAVTNAASSIVDGAKGFLGIKSPSRLFRDEVGKMIPQGIAVGVEADSKDAMKAVDNLTADLAMPKISPESALGMSGRMNTNPNNVSNVSTINNYGSNGEETEMIQLLKQIRDKTNDVLLDGTSMVKKLGTKIDENQGSRTAYAEWGLELNG